MRAPAHRSLLAATAFLAACTSPTEIRPDPEALDAAAEFRNIATAAHNAGADPDVVDAYYNIGTAIARAGRISPVTVVIDGTPLDFFATGQQIEMGAGPACAPTGSTCLTVPPLRSVVAWQKSDPRRVVQLATVGGSSQIGQSVATSFPSSTLQIASVVYFDGSGGAYFGTSGTLSLPDPATSDTPCRTESLGPDVISAPELEQCTRAEFTAAVTSTVVPPPFVVRGNTATGTHTIAMASQPVHGARFVFPPLPALACPACEGYPPFSGPVALRGGDLRAQTSTSVTASLVTFELRITNPQTVPVTVQFSSGQQFDFRVRPVVGPAVWTWSGDKAFTGALATRTFAPGETVTYTATWTPTVHGSFVADGWLTSTSHVAASSTGLVIP